MNNETSKTDSKLLADLAQELLDCGTAPEIVEQRVADVAKELAAQNDATRFAPLRAIANGDGGYDICTRADDTPGSRNNFVLATCQHRAEAILFAAAPELLAALKAIVECVPLEFVTAKARAALAKAQSVTP